MMVMIGKVESRGRGREYAEGWLRHTEKIKKGEKCRRN